MINPHIIRKTVDPSVAPPEAGIHWINTSTGAEFFSVGDSSVGDWIPRVASANTFIELTDVPSSYAGQSLKAVRVNIGETGLEFVTGGASDEFVKISAADTTAGYLNDKLIITSGKLTKTIVNPGANEDLQLSIGADVFDKTVDDSGDITEGTNLFYTNERVDDRVASLIVAGTGITSTYNDPANTLTIATTITQYTDELAQDAVGSILTDSSSIDFTYNDGANTITATVIQSGIDHGSISGLADDDHTQYHNDTRADTWLGTKSTTNLAEGSNLYFTDERAQDAVGTALTDSSSIDFTYNDGANTITAAVLPAGVDHDALQNFVANEHIDHTSITITAGIGLAGGGDISANRTIDLDITELTAESTVAANDLIAIYDDSAGAHRKMTRSDFLAGTTTDEQVKITASDTTPGYLDGKLIVASGKLTKTVINPGANEDLELSIGADVFDKTVDDSGDINEGTNLFFTDERAQDAIGTILVDSSTIDLTYNDGTPSITASVIQSGIDHGSISGLADDDHTQYHNDTRADTWLGTKSTTNLAEGTNLYFTDERAQDAVGTSLTDSSSIDFTYNDGANTITAAVLPAGVDHDALQNFVANEHIDHTTVSISAGTGLSGGGDISANRTINLADTAVTPNPYGTATQVASFTVDQQGRLTAASNTNIQTSSDTQIGLIEIATTAETDTGTDATRAVSPDGLAGSYAGSKNIGLYVVEVGTALTTGDGKAYMRIPATLNGMNLVMCSAAITTTSSSGNPTFMIARGRQSSPTSAHSYVDMLSTPITIDATEYDSKDATTPVVINTSNDDVTMGDLIRIDIDGIGTGSAGLIITTTFQLP
jgi:hypothetical protein